VRCASLCLLLAACAGGTLPHHVHQEKWEIWFEPSLALDHERTLAYLEDFYAGFRIAFEQVYGEPAHFISLEWQPSAICVYDQARPYYGRALVDAGNRRSEANCGTIPSAGVALGVFAGGMESWSEAEYWVAIVLAHEIGHGLGLIHTEPPDEGSIMNAQLMPQGEKRFLPEAVSYLEIVLGRERRLSSSAGQHRRRASQ
jgi:hypothetical protein